MLFKNMQSQGFEILCSGLFLCLFYLNYTYIFNVPNIYYEGPLCAMHFGKCFICGVLYNSEGCNRSQLHVRRLRLSLYNSSIQILLSG